MSSDPKNPGHPLDHLGTDHQSVESVLLGAVSQESSPQTADCQFETADEHDLISCNLNPCKHQAN